MASCSCCCSVFIALLAILMGYPMYYTFSPPQVAEIRGKCAIVTGASTGIGVMIAHKLAEEGVTKLAIAARQQDKLDSVAADIKSKYPATTVLTVKMDVSKDEDRAALVADVAKNFGFCDILVNNAGVEHWVHYDKVPKSKIDQQLNVNLFGLMHLTHDILPSMIKAGKGHIVSISSLAGLACGPGTSIYCATKHGVHGFTKALRAEMIAKKTGVTVHVIAPGFIDDTGMAKDMEDKDHVDLEGLKAIYGRSQGIESADAVVYAIKHDDPDIIVNHPNMRAVFALQVLFPRMAEAMTRLPGMEGVTETLLKIMDIQT